MSELPTMSDTNNENVGTVKANIHAGIADCSRHFRHFRQENDGVGLEHENLDAKIKPRPLQNDTNFPFQSNFGLICEEIVYL